MISAAGLLLLIVILNAPIDKIHSWYPRECCSDKDCMKLHESRVKIIPSGYLIDGRFLVAFQNARLSPDDDYHGCFPPDFSKFLGCFFAPKGSS